MGKITELPGGYNRPAVPLPPRAPGAWMEERMAENATVFEFFLADAGEERAVLPGAPTDPHVSGATYVGGEGATAPYARSNRYTPPPCRCAQAAAPRCRSGPRGLDPRPRGTGSAGTARTLRRPRSRRVTGRPPPTSRGSPRRASASGAGRTAPKTPRLTSALGHTSQGTRLLASSARSARSSATRTPWVMREAPRDPLAVAHGVRDGEPA